MNYGFYDIIIKKIIMMREKELHVLNLETLKTESWLTDYARRF